MLPNYTFYALLQGQSIQSVEIKIQLSVDPYTKVWNGDYLFYQIYLLQLETLGVCKIVIPRYTQALKLGSSNRKLYADFKIGLNLENPYSWVCRPLFPVF